MYGCMASVVTRLRSNAGSLILPACSLEQCWALYRRAVFVAVLSKQASRAVAVIDVVAD